MTACNPAIMTPDLLLTAAAWLCLQATRSSTWRAAGPARQVRSSWRCIPGVAFAAMLLLACETGESFHRSPCRWNFPSLLVAAGLQCSDLMHSSPAGPPPVHPPTYLPACLLCPAGLALGVDMDEQLPPNEYYDYYGPGGQLALHSRFCDLLSCCCILSVAPLLQSVTCLCLRPCPPPSLFCCSGVHTESAAATGIQQLQRARVSRQPHVGSHCDVPAAAALDCIQPASL